MAESSDIVFYRYSPENMSEDILRKLFVSREKLLENLVREIEDASKNETPRFYLMVGPRGIGKSHFLTLLYYEIENKVPSLIPIKLAEEEYSIYRASDFFLRILEENSVDVSDVLSLDNENEILHASLDKLKQISKHDDKNFIIFIENLHELFKQLDKEELHKLRSTFQKYDIFSVVATAPLIFPFISEHEEPFYNFFRIQHLKEFSIDEIKELMRKIAKTENNMEFLDNFEQYEEKIHGIIHLTGGSPRLAFLFYEMITRGEIKDIEKSLFKIIDEHTPFYQEVFQLLTAQQRRIFDILISFGEPVTPKQISQKARMNLPTVNTQLRRLETNGYVISRPMGRHTKYEVRERLFRLWREMRQPFGRKRVSILLDFLQLWYTPAERKELFKSTFKFFEAGDRSVMKDLCYYAEIQPHEFKAEALLKLTPKLLEMGENEDARYEINKLKEHAAKYKGTELESKISHFEWQLLFSENKYEEVIEAIDKSLENVPGDNIALTIKSVALANIGKYEEALEVFNKALEINPDDNFILTSKGSALADIGKYEEALEVFNKALEIDSNDNFTLTSKGNVLADIGNYEEALEVFNKALKIDPNDNFTLISKGDALANLGMHEKALETFNVALEINSNNDFALSRKGAILVDLGEYGKALEVFNKALEIDSNDNFTLTSKGIALIHIGEYEEALEVFNKALEINPVNNSTLANKGISLGYLGKFEAALETFNKAIEINPDDSYTLANKGVALTNIGKHEEALEVFNKSLEINPNDEFTLAGKGDILTNLEMYEEALEVFNKVLEINPVDISALANKGVALSNIGKYEEALEVFNKSLEINPYDDFVLIRKGTTLSFLEMYDEGFEAFDKSLEMNPKNNVALGCKGIVLVTLEKYEEALNVFNMALEIDPNDEFVLEHKAFALFNLKRHTEGLDVARKMVDIATDGYSKINASLIEIEAYIALNRKSEAAFEIENIESKMIDQEPDLIENFMDICFDLARDELKDDNRGSASKFIKIAFKNSFKLKDDAVKELTMGFLKSAADTGILSVMKDAVEEIIGQQKDEFEQLIRPIIKAIEIVETKDLKKYYDLQIEEREIVADVVKRITKSDELIPDEIKGKD